MTSTLGEQQAVDYGTKVDITLQGIASSHSSPEFTDSACLFSECHGSAFNSAVRSASSETIALESCRYLIHERFRIHFQVDTIRRVRVSSPDHFGG